MIALTLSRWLPGQFRGGVAPPIDTAFVIVDRGDLVNDIVMAPQANLVTAVLRRVGD